MSYLGGRSTGTNLPGRGLINPAFVIKIVPATDNMQQTNSQGRDNPENDYLDNLDVGTEVEASVKGVKITGRVLQIIKNEKGDGVYAIVKTSNGKEIKIEGSRIKHVTSSSFDDSKVKLQSSPTVFNESKFLSFNDFLNN